MRVQPSPDQDYAKPRRREGLVALNLRQRVARELLILVVLSTGFLVLFPRRPISVDMGLALFALGLILLTARHTRSAIWGPLPVELKGTRWQRCAVSTTLLTVPVILFFCLLGMYIGYERGGEAGVGARLLHPKIPIAIALYLPWALLQQTLFQFYLLGRVRTLWPSLHPLSHSALNGLAFGLVHLPNLWVVLLAGLGGAAWSRLYIRYRLLWPLALSHAVLGTTFYYWVYGQDLMGAWVRVLARLLRIG